MAIYAQSFAVTGVANVSTKDTGIESTETEKRRVTKLQVRVSGAVGNKIQLWLDREKLAEWYDYFFLTEASTGSTNIQVCTNRILEMETNVEVPLGQKLQVAIECGATAKNLSGSYIYERV